jgi:hypothetical protein
MILSVSTQGDITAPGLADLQIQPSTIDTSNSPQTITVMARFTDDLSGFHDAFIIFVPQIGTTQWHEVQFFHQRLISGTLLDGIYTDTLVMPQFAAEGRWLVQGIALVDMVGNRKSYCEGCSDGFPEKFKNYWFVNGEEERPDSKFQSFLPLVRFQLPPPAPEPSYEFNKALLQKCSPNAGVTYVEGTTYKNGQPANGYNVAFSYATDGPIIAQTISGPHQGYPGWRTGFYSHIIDSASPREGDWYFWIVDGSGKRISQIAHVHTDGEAGDGTCQQAVIDFDS